MTSSAYAEREPDWSPRDDHEWRLRTWVDWKTTSVRHKLGGSIQTIAEAKADHENRIRNIEDDVSKGGPIDERLKKIEDSITWLQRLVFGGVVIALLNLVLSQGGAG